MKLTSAKNFITKTLGIILPIFLFISVICPQISTASELSGVVGITFKSGAENLPSLTDIYGLDEASRIFADSQDPELAGYYRANIFSNNLANFKSDGRVTAVSVDQTVSAILIPNDQYFSLDEAKDDKQWYLPKIGMPEAWEFGQGSDKIIVAVVDTGIHASHVDLEEGQIIAGYNSIKKHDIEAEVDSDDNGHGTAVSGIIGATTNNKRGVAGINWNVSIMPIKALGANGKGVVSSVAAGIVWATDHQANIINLSLGGSGFGADEALNAAVRYAFSHNVLIVAAAGNDLAAQGTNLDTNPIYPICADNGDNMILGVAASDINDRKADFSNFGTNCVDITAPGKKILTTAFLPEDPSDNVLIYGSGTSVAAPIVAGVAALMKSNKSRLTNVQIRDIILGTADNIDHLNTNNCLNTSCTGFLGKGRINAAAALNPNPMINGSLIKKESNHKIYQIQSGTKRYVSNFVFEQRGYDRTKIVDENHNQLSDIPTGDPIAPYEGTLIKSESDRTVYIINQGLKSPVSALVFKLRGFSFSNVNSLPARDVSGLTTGNWYWPPDRTTMIVKGSSTVYAMDKGIGRPVTLFVFNQRGFSFGRVNVITQDEFSHIPKALDPYWLAPQDGTLVKSASDPTVYIIKDQTRQALTSAGFTRLNLKYSSIKVLPQSEIDIIMPSDPAL